MGGSRAGGTAAACVGCAAPTTCDIQPSRQGVPRQAGEGPSTPPGTPAAAAAAAAAPAATGRAHRVPLHGQLAVGWRVQAGGWGHREGRPSATAEVWTPSRYLQQMQVAGAAAGRLQLAHPSSAHSRRWCPWAPPISSSSPSPFLKQNWSATALVVCARKVPDGGAPVAARRRWLGRAGMAQEICFSELGSGEPELSDGSPSGKAGCERGGFKRDAREVSLRCVGCPSRADCQANVIIRKQLWRVEG